MSRPELRRQADGPLVLLRNPTKRTTPTATRRRDGSATGHPADRHLRELGERMRSRDDGEAELDVRRDPCVEELDRPWPDSGPRRSAKRERARKVVEPRQKLLACAIQPEADRLRAARGDAVGPAPEVDKHDLLGLLFVLTGRDPHHRAAPLRLMSGHRKTTRARLARQAVARERELGRGY